MSTPRSERTLGIGGDLVPPGPNQSAQWRYLMAVQRVAPQALTALAKIAVDRTPLSSREFERRLREWCEQWGFTGSDRPDGRDWLRSVARRTAQHLRDEPTGLMRMWAPPREAFSGPIPFSEQPPAVSFDPSVETEQQFRDRIDVLIATTKAIARSQGWTEPPRKRTDEHFEWLVRYQVCREAPEEIGGRYSGKRVLKAVHETATLIGLSLRPAQKGRRPSLRKKATQKVLP